MSNQTKFLISLLFIVAIILAAGLTRFYFDVTKNTDHTDEQDKIASLVHSYPNGMCVFKSTNGFFGLLDAEGAIIIDAEWREILTVTDHMVLVSRTVQNEPLIGGIDFEGNVILPFTFRSFEALTDRCYLAQVAEDERYVVYNDAFEAMFQYSWENAVYDSGMLTLEKDGCTFAFYIADEEPIFRRAQMTCLIGDKPLNWNVSNRIYLSELEPQELIRINQCVSDYLDMLVTNDFERLPEISAPEYSSALSKTDLFKGFVFDEINGFSFSSLDREKKVYDFTFTIQYHSETPVETGTETIAEPAEIYSETSGSVQVHLYFQRDSSHQLILTSVALDYRKVQTAPPDAEQ